MKWLRRFAMLSALALLFGEPWRSIGSERFAYVWIDDVAVAALLIASTLALAHAGEARRTFARALFASAWAATAVILYNSFFEKYHGLHAGASDAERLLAAFLGVGFLAVSAAFVLSLRLADRQD